MDGGFFYFFTKHQLNNQQVCNAKKVRAYSKLKLSSPSSRSLLTFIPVSALYLMKLLLPAILALMAVVSSAHTFTARKVKRQKLSSFPTSKRQTTVNVTNNTQNGINIRCVVSALLLSCALSRTQVLYAI